MKRITSPYISSKQKTIAIIIAMIAYWLILLALTSCRSTKPLVSVPRNDSIVVRDHVRHDSIYIHDSVIVHLKGDTVYCDRWHTRYKAYSVLCTDTIYRDKEVVVDHPPERYIPAWAWWTLGVCIALVLLIIIRICARLYLR